MVEMVKADTIDIVHQMPQLNVREIDMPQNMALALDYLSYQLQHQIEKALRVAGAQICKQQQEVWDSTPVQVQPGLFTSTHSDMIYKFKCPNLTGSLSLRIAGMISLFRAADLLFLITSSSHRIPAR